MTRFDLIFYCDRRKFNLTGGFLIFLFMLTGREITFYLQHWYCCKILYPKMFAGGPHYASAISGGQFLRFFLECCNSTLASNNFNCKSFFFFKYF